MQAIVICTIGNPGVTILLESIKVYAPQLPIYLCSNDLRLWGDIRSRMSGLNVIFRPNPATNFMYIGYTTPETALVKISLFDEKGALVAFLGQSSVEGIKHIDKIDCSTFAAGTYHISVECLSTAGVHLYTKERKIIIIN